MRAGWFALVSFGLIGLLTSTGCNKSQSSSEDTRPTPPAPPGGRMGTATQNIVAQLPGGEQYAAGKKVYSDNNCVRCHKLGETGGAPGGGQSRGGFGGGFGRGPDLTKVAANPEHTKQWLADHIRNPKGHNPQSRMPPFGPEKISDADLNALTDYLVSLK